jgi:uncharacterized protein
MKTFLGRIDRLRLLALLLWAVPVAALLPLGLIWLWQAEAVRYWLAALVLFSAAGYGLQFWLHRTERRWLEDAETEPDPDWPPAADRAWAMVEDLAAQTKPEDWPIGRAPDSSCWASRRSSRSRGTFIPRSISRLLELTVPHTLLMIERASRDLRDTITDHIPFSHRLTVGSLVRAYRWKPFADRLLGLYRAGHWVVNPANALLTEALAQLRGRGYAMAQDELYRWILQEYVRKVGAYAIDLYSGRLLLSDDVSPESRPTPHPSVICERRIRRTSRPASPCGSWSWAAPTPGKSSLINALFGQLRVATDLLPDTTKMLTPYRLAREGSRSRPDLRHAGIRRMDEQTLRTAAGDADMILWVSAADRPDRHADRETLDSLRAAFAERLTRRRRRCLSCSAISIDCARCASGCRPMTWPSPRA